MIQYINCPECGQIAQLIIAYSSEKDSLVRHINCHHCKYRNDNLKGDNITGGPC